MLRTRVSDLFRIEFPIIQGGMVWVSGWRLASAVSNSGGLGLIGSGSMKPELLSEHIIKCKKATDFPFGVNIPLLRKDAEELIKTSAEHGIKIIFTSAGHPGKFIDLLKSKNMIVVHVVSNVKQGLKAESAGCDAVVGEGFEAGGHNGPDELTTFTLIPQLTDNLNIPVIAAGGIADGRGIYAALSLGAEGVQIGTRFAATVESSAHDNYKRKVIEASDTSTTIAPRKVAFARMIKNNFSRKAGELEDDNISIEKLIDLLGAKREKLGIFEGDEDEGMMEAGQSCGSIKEILTVEKLFDIFISDIKKINEKFNKII